MGWDEGARSAFIAGGRGRDDPAAKAKRQVSHAAAKRNRISRGQAVDPAADPPAAAADAPADADAPAPAAADAPAAAAAAAAPRPRKPTAEAAAAAESAAVTAVAENLIKAVLGAADRRKPLAEILRAVGMLIELLPIQDCPDFFELVRPHVARSIAMANMGLEMPCGSAAIFQDVDAMSDQNVVDHPLMDSSCMAAKVERKEGELIAEQGAAAAARAQARLHPANRKETDRSGVSYPISRTFVSSLAQA